MNHQNFTGFSGIPYSSIGLFLRGKPGDKLMLSDSLLARHVEINPNDVSPFPKQSDSVGTTLCGFVFQSRGWPGWQPAHRLGPNYLARQRLALPSRRPIWRSGGCFE